MTEDPIIRVENLTLGFSSNQAGTSSVLKNISLELNKGEILGIVGESGSGKSMTALSIIQLLPSGAQVSEASKIILKHGSEHVDLLSLSEKQMVAFRGSSIGMVFQEPMSSLNPSMKCGLQILEAVELHNNYSALEAKNQVFELLKSVGISEHDRVYNSYPHQLSGGQLQRIMIAIAVAGRPSVLITDEPTTALDVTVQKEILTLIRKVRDLFSSSTIFISHDLAVVNQLCDRVLVMKDGEILERGTVKEVFLNSKNPYTKALISARPPDNLKLRRLATAELFQSDKNVSYDQFISQNTLSKTQVDNELRKIENSPTILNVSKLCKEFKSRSFFGPKKKKLAVDEVSFKIRENEILGLVGESGSGKSTLGRMICKLIEPSSGSIEFNSREISTLDRKSLKAFRKQCQIIFQDPFSSLNPRIKVGKSIEEAFVAHNIGSKDERKDWVIDLLKDVGLEAAHYERYPHEFSGGQRQRVSIARAIALKPKLLICDESVSALDVSVQAKILNLLLDLREKYDMSYLFISHDLSVVHFIADNIMVMKAGKIVEKGSASQIYNSPQNEYTKSLISAIPKFII